MKKTLLIVLFVFPLQYGFSQDTAYKMMKEILVRGTIHPKAGVQVTEKRGSYADPKTGRLLGQFRLIFSEDTLSRQLLNIVTIEKSRKEQVTIYYFNQGLLAQVATGTKEGKSTTVDNLFTYTEEDNQIEDKVLKTLSEGSEKYNLLQAARNYVLSFQKNKEMETTEEGSKPAKARMLTFPFLFF